RIVNRTLEACTAGRDCEDVVGQVARLGTTAFTVASVTRETAEIYRDDSALAFIATNAAKRAGKHPAHLDGYVKDSAGNPVSRAVIQTIDPARVAFTNDSGFFRIRTLPADTVSIRIRSHGFDPVGFRLQLIADSTRHLNISL